MFDNLNKKVLLVGAGQMGVDYYKVLKALNCTTTIIGRGENSAKLFEEKTGISCITGGLETFLNQNEINFDAAIIAVGMEQLGQTAIQLLNSGFKNILIEKPAGLNEEEITELANRSNKHEASIFVAYNRRFYASVLKAKEIIELDGGVTSFNFEFTEWAHVIEPLIKANGVKDKWLLGNSTHVIDLAFYLGGEPSEMSCYAGGKLSWHDKAIYSGAGICENNALFSYQANWNAPGRWGLEVLTKKSRLIFRPLEELKIQLIGSVSVSEVEIDHEIDKNYKAGLFIQTAKFLLGETNDFQTIQKQAKMCEFYNQIAKGNSIVHA